MSIYIKNNSGSVSTYLGQQINDTEYYEIQPSELVSWQNNSLLITDIGSGDAIVAKSDDSNNDITDVSSAINYLKNTNIPTDLEGSPIYRSKAAKSGWTYNLNGVEFETSVLSSIYHKDFEGNDQSEATIKFYNSSDVELTVQGDLDTDCVKTVLDFEPLYDYEIIGGTIKSDLSITDDYRVWVVAVPDLTVLQGGSKVMVNNINLRYIDPDNGVEADGRVSKYMTYNATYHTNKIRLIIKHPAGGKEKIMIAYEMYKV